MLIRHLGEVSTSSKTPDRARGAVLARSRGAQALDGRFETLEDPSSPAADSQPASRGSLLRASRQAVLRPPKWSAPRGWQL